MPTYALLVKNPIAQSRHSCAVCQLCQSGSGQHRATTCCYMNRTSPFARYPLYHEMLSGKKCQRQIPWIVSDEPLERQHPAGKVRVFVQQLPGHRALQKARSSTGAHALRAAGLCHGQVWSYMCQQRAFICQKAPALHLLITTSPSSCGTVRLHGSASTALPPSQLPVLWAAVPPSPERLQARDGTVCGTAGTQRLPSPPGPSSQQAQTNLEGFLGPGRHAASSCPCSAVAARWVHLDTLVPQGPPGCSASRCGDEMQKLLRSDQVSLQHSSLILLMDGSNCLHSNSLQMPNENLGVLPQLAARRCAEGEGTLHGGPTPPRSQGWCQTSSGERAAHLVQFVVRFSSGEDKARSRWPCTSVTP